MTFARVNILGWAFQEVLTSGQMNTLDIDHVDSLDGRDGGIYSSTGELEYRNTWVFSGDGVVIDNTARTMLTVRAATQDADVPFQSTFRVDGARNNGAAPGGRGMQITAGAGANEGGEGAEIIGGEADEGPGGRGAIITGGDSLSDGVGGVGATINAGDSDDGFVGTIAIIAAGGAGPDSIGGTGIQGTGGLGDTGGDGINGVGQIGVVSNGGIGVQGRGGLGTIIGGAGGLFLGGIGSTGAGGAGIQATGGVGIGSDGSGVIGIGAGAGSLAGALPGTGVAGFGGTGTGVKDGGFGAIFQGGGTDGIAVLASGAGGLIGDVAQFPGRAIRALAAPGNEVVIVEAEGSGSVGVRVNGSVTADAIVTTTDGGSGLIATVNSGTGTPIIATPVATSGIKGAISCGLQIDDPSNPDFGSIMFGTAANPSGARMKIYQQFPVLGWQAVVTNTTRESIKSFGGATLLNGILTTNQTFNLSLSITGTGSGSRILCEFGLAFSDATFYNPTVILAPSAVAAFFPVITNAIGASFEIVIFDANAPGTPVTLDGGSGLDVQVFISISGTLV